MSVVAASLLVAFLAMLLGGVPIAFTLGLAGLLGLWVADIDLILLAQRTVSGSQVFTLLAIPGFMLAGELMRHGGLSRRLIRIGNALVQHVTGGLGMVTVLSATFFAAISGSAPATTAAIGGVMVPEMEKHGYRRDFATALAAASGPIGQMIPPSIPMVIWGVVAEESIARLFLAGVVPGLLIMVALMALCWVKARSMGVPRATRRATLGELGDALYDGKWALLAPVIILGGIYGGVFTPTEAAAVGVGYGFLAGTLAHRELRLGAVPEIVLAAMKTSSMVVFIIATASIFGWLVAVERLPAAIGAAILGVSDDPVVIILLLNATLLLIGAVMDNIAAMIILGSVLTGVGAELGLDPIHLGAIVVVNFAIGMATPPFGYSIFVGAAISGLSVERISKAIWPMLVAQVAVLLAITFIPALTTTLPRAFGP